MAFQMPNWRSNRAIVAATLIAQGKIAIDTLILYEVPIPDEFRNAPGQKENHCLVGVRPARQAAARRLPWSGDGNELVPREDTRGNCRGISIRHKEERRTRQGALRDPFNATSCPNANGRDQHVAAKGVGVQRRDDKYGETYYLMIQARRNWAPAEIRIRTLGSP